MLRWTSLRNSPLNTADRRGFPPFPPFRSIPNHPQPEVEMPSRPTEKPVHLLPVRPVFNTSPPPHPPPANPESAVVRQNALESGAEAGGRNWTLHFWWSALFARLRPLVMPISPTCIKGQALKKIEQRNPRRFGPGGATYR